MHLNNTETNSTQAIIQIASVKEKPYIKPQHLNLIIRTDQRFATATLKHGIITTLKPASNKEISRTDSYKTDHHNDLRHTRFKKSSLQELEQTVESTLKEGYRVWASQILHAMHQKLIEGQPNSNNNLSAITAHIFKNKELEAECKALANTAFSKETLPVFQLSLDEQIEGDGELGISRLFDQQGTRINSDQGDPIYIARPEKSPIKDQLEILLSALKVFKTKHQIDGKVPVVLLEDNVRHARMLNKVIQILISNPNIKDLIEIKGIATEFCCASKKELQQIKSDGDPNSSSSTIPIKSVIEFDLEHREVLDVTTPRDFLFDGLVVKLNDGSFGRMPSFYVHESNDLTSDRQMKSFIRKIKSINEQFCAFVHDTLGVAPRIGWFRGGKAILEKESSSVESNKSLSKPIKPIFEPKETNENQVA